MSVVEEVKKRSSIDFDQKLRIVMLDCLRSLFKRTGKLEDRMAELEREVKELKRELRCLLKDGVNSGEVIGNSGS